ncbi:TIR domain-containing protein [Massilia sp. LMS1-1-1.1]
MNTVKEPPKVFISYSWSGAEHEQFVIELATALRTHGIDAILDKWRLKPGQDKYVFMESMVTDASVVKVLVICDRKYKEKADIRAGGVGTESQIISSELYSKVAQTKFIPIVAERDDDGKEFLPVFMAGRIYVDLSSDEKWGDGLDELLRLIYDQPINPEPKLGDVPKFLKPDSNGLPTAKELPSALRSIRDGKSNREGLESLFVRSMLTEMKQRYVTPDGKPGYDEEIYQAILQTKGLRNQFSEYIESVATFLGDEPRALKQCTYLLEQLGQLFGPPIENGMYVAGWADIYRFFALEATLIVTATLLRHERWHMLRHWLKYPFLVRTDHHDLKAENIIAFDSFLSSMDEHRNNRLSLNRTCLTADMLRERCSAEHTPFNELLQADMFLALYGIAQLKGRGETNFPVFWRPRTAVYSTESLRLPIFLKAIDSDIRNNILFAIGVASGADLAERVVVARSQTDNFRHLLLSRMFGFSFESAVNLQALTK